jgi:hypothetical protein
MSRIRKSMSTATGTQQLTPDVAFFIHTNAYGRWQSDYDTGVFAPAYLHRRHPDGTIDTVRLSPTQENYLELQGRSPKDVAIGRI